MQVSLETTSGLERRLTIGVPAEQVESEVERIKNDFGISYSTILPFSSERKVYTDNVWKEIEKYL